MRDVGEHEIAIAKLFGNRVRYNELGPRHPIPLLVLAFTNRCGSNLLAEYLLECGTVAGLREVLNGYEVSELSNKMGAGTFPAYISELVGADGRPVYGVKASWDQILMLLRWRIDKMFSSIRILHIERNDILAQAASFSIALQTKRWTSADTGIDVAPVYNEADIAHWMERLGNGNKLITQICSLYQLDRFRLTYEDLIDNPVSTLLAIHRWLGLPLLKFDVAKVNLSRQSDEHNESFIDRYRSKSTRDIGGDI